MGALVWVMMGLALWHFTIFVPDRFWAGIVGAFLGALFGALLFGLLVNGFSVPGQNDTNLLTAAEAIPGALLGIAAVYFYGAKQGNEPLQLAGAAVALALAAALLHAVWNLLLARAPDTAAATAVAIAIGVALYAVPALVTWRVEASAWPYVGASAAFELGYVITLAGGLRRGDLSVVYPLARGSAPVLVLAVSAGVLGAATSAWQVAGVLLVAGGVLAVRGLRRPDDPAVIALALACGACIAGYTIVDSRGLDHAAPLPYLWVVIALMALGYLPLTVATRGAAAVRAALRWETVAAAVLFFAAYLLVLAALRLADPGPVAAVRETSVVIATALGALLLREPVTPARWAGVCVVAAGVALIALS